jgi:pyrimidine-specific ribonucleoside hydrolase
MVSEKGRQPPLHVVVDGGIDDALALAVLIGAGTSVAQVIATEGSRPLGQTALTTARILASFGSTIPVRLGVASGLSGPYPQGRDPFHGEDCFAGLCDTLGVADQPEESWEPLDGPVFATGALTVPAVAVAAGQLVGPITWMGGSGSYGGNMTATAEFNAWMDPEAVDDLCLSGHLATMIPLDVTMRCAFTEEDIQGLKDCSSAGALIGSAAGVLCGRDGSFVPHDGVAAAAVLSPELFGWAARRVRCERGGILTRGATVVDRRPKAELGSTLIAEDVDAGAVRKVIFEAVASISP